MNVRNGYRSVGANGVGFYRGVSIVLCAILVASPVYGAVGMETTGGGAGTIPVERHTAALTEQEKVLHALNRFTFGPRPGDAAAVETMGLDRWFEMQLHPGKIDDAAFEEEMGKFPAMRLSALELMRRFPSPQMIRQMGKDGVALPGNPVERAIYADAESEDKAKLKKDAVGAVGGVAGGVGGAAEEGAVAMNCNAKGGGGGCAGSGAMPAGQVEAVLGLGPEERMRRLVGMSPEEMMAFRSGLRPKDRGRLVEGLTPMEAESVEAMQGGPVRVVGAEAMESRLMRDVDSQRQLQAVMTEFWLNHFNVYLRKNQQEPYLLPEYEREVILPHALGKFEDLLVATAKSPAMLMYLDNWESVGPDSKAAGRAAQIQKMRPDGKMAQMLPKGINENYGRELMELHTLGVGGGYTQKDVVEVAKCFTGWTIDRPYGGMGGAGMAMGMHGGRFAPRDDATPGEFVFEPNRHEPGTKVVLGQKIAEGGVNEGMEVLHLLARSPQTAHFLSQELAVRFVSDTPPAALVDRMAKTYLKSDGDIAAVLTTMFRAKEFWSPEVYRAKVKTPLEFMTSALRASDARVTNALPLVQAMDRLGMPIYGMQTPNGYGWTEEDWVSSNALIARMNFALVLSGGRVAGTTVDWTGLLGDAAGSGMGPGVGTPSVGTENALEGALLGQAATDRTRSAVMAEFENPTVQEQAAAGFAGGTGLVAVKPVRERKAEAPLDTMAGLLLGSPEFQRR